MCTPAAPPSPPPQSPKLPGSTHFVLPPATPPPSQSQRVLPLPPPPKIACNTLTPQSPKLPESTHFGTFTPKILKRVLPPLPEPKIAWEYAFWNFHAQNTKTCTPACHRLGVRILELSSAQNTKTCTAAPLPHSPKLLGSTNFGIFERPKH